jgi:hypothetical protein
LETLKWLPLLPTIMAHPHLIAVVQANMPEAQQFLDEFQALLAKHQKLINLIETEAPEAVALGNQLTPIIRQILGQ